MRQHNLMSCLPHRIPPFSIAAMSSASFGALFCLLLCVLSMLCNTRHVETMFLCPFGHQISLPGFHIHYPLPSCLWILCSLLFSFSLSFVFCCRSHCTKEKALSPSKKVVQIWPSHLEGFRYRKLQGVILALLLQLAEVKYLCI